MITFVTIAHVMSGGIAVVMGATALAARKGASSHAKAGRVFAVSMGLSSFLGAGLGLIKFETFIITFHAGVLGLTLIISSWLLARGSKGHRSALFVAIACVNFLNTAGLIAAGFSALMLPDQILRGFAATDYFFLAGMSGVALVTDLNMLWRKTLSYRHRIAEHLWRMCLSFFIAAGSAFTGPGAGIFPEAVRNSGVLSFPELMIIVLMLFWLIRILRGKGPQKRIPSV